MVKPQVDCVGGCEALPHEHSKPARCAVCNKKTAAARAREECQRTGWLPNEPGPPSAAIATIQLEDD